MSEFTNHDDESISRQEAAERLTDIAYALMAGGSLRLEGGRLVGVADEVVLRREGRSSPDRVALALELSWTPRGAPRAAARARRDPSAGAKGPAGPARERVRPPRRGCGRRAWRRCGAGACARCSGRRRAPPLSRAPSGWSAGTAATRSSASLSSSLGGAASVAARGRRAGEHVEDLGQQAAWLVRCRRVALEQSRTGSQDERDDDPLGLGEVERTLYAIPPWRGCRRAGRGRRPPRAGRRSSQSADGARQAAPSITGASTPGPARGPPRPAGSPRPRCDRSCGSRARSLIASEGVPRVRRRAEPHLDVQDRARRAPSRHACWERGPHLCASRRKSQRLPSVGPARAQQPTPTGAPAPSSAPPRGRSMRSACSSRRSASSKRPSHRSDTPPRARGGGDHGILAPTRGPQRARSPPSATSTPVEDGIRRGARDVRDGEAARSPGTAARSGAAIARASSRCRQPPRSASSRARRCRGSSTRRRDGQRPEPLGGRSRSSTERVASSACSRSTRRRASHATRSRADDRSSSGPPARSAAPAAELVRELDVGAGLLRRPRSSRAPAERDGSSAS